MSKIKLPRPDRRIMSGQISKNVPGYTSRPILGKVIIFETWCKKCEICVHFCPTGALEMDPETGAAYLSHPEKCTLCGMCWNRCPELCILRGKDDNSTKQNNNGKEKEGTVENG